MSTDPFEKAIISVTATQVDMKEAIEGLSTNIGTLTEEMKLLKQAAYERDQFQQENKKLKEEVERLKEQLKALEGVSNKTDTQGFNGLF
jgi:FtsZ-binding cell division protein ZapB